jgi:serine protease Do
LGDTASFAINRNGEERRLAIKLEAAPDTPARQKTALAGRQPFGGATVANLNPALADELRQIYDEPGVVVLEVAGNSIAARVGVQPGDRVVAVNENKVDSVNALMAEVEKPAASWSIVLNRNGQLLKTTIGE